MEPLAKRMRILRSVEVDEENHDYIKEKQKNQQRLKSQFESIFEKFGNMNESQSDEIDMKTNRVVVDRGHLRRLKRQINGKGKTLLDTIVLSDGGNLENDKEEEEEDSEDELALPQMVKSKTTGPPEQDMNRRQIEPTEINAQHPTLLQPAIPATFIPQSGVPQTPNTSNPAADLLRHVQFPQTPAGTEAQSAAFYANLLQTINHAVHQFTAGLNTPEASTSFANAAPAPITPITTNDKVAPATDPKWFFPPLSAKPRQCPIAQSSPLPSHPVASTAKEAVQQHEKATSIDMAEERPTMTLNSRIGESSPTRPRRSSPRVEIQRRSPWTARKYHFTCEDDVYISKRKRMDGVSWAAIKDGREKWKTWPVSAFHNRWILIKNQNPHLQEPSISTEQVHTSSKPSHHLPTPSSSEHEESHQSLPELTEERSPNMLSSSAHFDDDDRDLLSLAGTDSDEEQLPTGDDGIIEVASKDVILPSIETRHFVDQDTMPENLLADLPTQDTITTPTRVASVTIKTEPTFSSPTALIKRIRFPTITEAILNSQENEDDMQDDFSNIIVALHQPNEQTTHTTPLQRSTSLSLIDTATDDELLAFSPNPPNPTTPSLQRKHEISTPATASLFTSYQTFKTRDVDGRSETGTIKSPSKVDRKKFYQRVKRGWTKNGMQVKEIESAGKWRLTPARKNGEDRRSLGGLEVRKRKWLGCDDGSEDELAM